MATAGVPTAGDNLKCPSCSKIFDIPRILPCFHTLCEDCLCTHIISEVQDGSHFPCPICKVPTIPPDTEVTVDKWAGTFPLDNIISILQHVEPNDDFCDVCKRDENITADIWCMDCLQKMCKSCNEYHKKFKMFSKHSTVPFEEIKDNLLNVKFNFDRDCIHHKEKKEEVFCVDHREMCCLVCSLEKHRHCRNKPNIDDVADEQVKQMASFNVLQTIEKVKTEIDKIITHKNENVDHLEREKEEILQNMDDLVDRLITKLKGLRITLRNETEQKCSDSKCSLQKNYENIQCFMTNLVNACIILDNLQKHGSTRQKFVIFESILSQILSHHQQLVLDLKDDTEIHFSLKRNTELLDLEKTLTSVGKIEIEESSKSLENNITNVDTFLKKLKSRTKLNTVLFAAQVRMGKMDLMTSPARFIKAVTRTELGEGTWFSGGTLLNDGRLIMADMFNNRLVQLDGEYDFVKEYKIEGSPTDVAAGNTENELFIAVYNNSVKRCTLKSLLIFTDNIEAPSQTWGLAVSSDRIIAGSPKEAVILNHKGSILKNIPKSGGLCYVALPMSSRILYHNDGDTVVYRTFEGNETYRYKHDLLKYPLGISIDGQNNVYVCGNESHNVHQISSDQGTTRILLPNMQNMTAPCGVVFNARKNELIVTSFNEDTVFEVYRLG